MKKLFVLLLALSCVGAFAQVTVAGYDKAKATYDSVSEGAAFSDEIRFNLTAKDADGKYGFSGRFQGSSGTMSFDTVTVAGVDQTFDEAITTANNTFAVKYMYGWANFFDGMLKLSAGKINEGGYQFGQNEANSIQGNVSSDNAMTSFKDIRTQSMEITLAPIAGLTASAIYTPNGSVAACDWKFGVAYAVENLLNIKAMATMNAADKFLATFGAEFVGVENLSAVAGGKVYNDGTDPFFGIYSIIGYTMDKLFVEVAADINTKTDLVDSGYYFEGQAEYTLETLSVRGFGQYNKDHDLAEAGNEYLVGAELSVPVGGGEFNVGVNYGDVTEVSLPVYLKIAF